MSEGREDIFEVHAFTFSIKLKIPKINYFNSIVRNIQLIIILTIDEQLFKIMNCNSEFE